MLRADGLICAIELPAGARSARFEFTPPGFVAGAWISVLTLSILVGAFALRRYRS